MLKNKTILLGVTGSIAAYKAASLASLLVKNHATVHVIMTEHAVNIINPITFETLTGKKCLIDTFDRNFQYNVEHVALSKKADLFIVAPATANTIAKLAHGIADDMLSTTFLACTCPKLLSPAMNTQMLENPVTQKNLEICASFGMKIVESATGHLACGDEGKGKMPEPDVLLEHIIHEIACEKDLRGKKILVTAGPTQEALDPVRFITNHSTGKMGFALARMASLRGADVTLVSGVVHEKTPLFVKRIDIKSAKDMFQAVKEHGEHCDIIIKAAAVADYRPANYVDEKMKKSDGELSIPLERTDDILKYLGEHKGNRFLCGFSMETQNMVENSRKKLEKKNIDMIVANNLKVAGAGFGTDTNIVTLITRDGEKELPIMPKEQVASYILDEILNRL
ncbi:MAG: bifunctional phosphopantothenoylcysteine decarboxylase/phosphopantothenate--cysteine ligase CoaBC [Treponema sp.]|nr:bifunctional phosphopantothenoylcysteine decarboxylase/phosphopantothenate--cysteine ligase CoaBC [Treponema sp.]